MIDIRDIRDIRDMSCIDFFYYNKVYTNNMMMVRSRGTFLVPYDVTKAEPVHTWYLRTAIALFQIWSLCGICCDVTKFHTFQCAILWYLMFGWEIKRHQLNDSACSSSESNIVGWNSVTCYGKKSTKRDCALNVI